MAVYAIADLHLSHGVDKPMEKFGSRWTDHPDKIRRRWCALVEPGDTVVLPGDFSWAMNLEEAEEDFRFLASLPGKKLLGKGNHDYWWTSVSKMKASLAEWGISDVDFLHNSAAEADGMILCGTRGWFYEEEKGDDHDAKILRRELMRLETSLKAAGDREKLVFLHYPPKLLNYECTEILDLLCDYGVKRCWYGHLHSGGRALAYEGEYRGIRLKLISADHLQFFPQKIM